ncbi:MAG: hypothetical protein M0R77_19095 [Gammaproteobacteria bacterium]|nr:hypothetical protein [Gammaproteobacteria bacterium]
MFEPYAILGLSFEEATMLANENGYSILVEVEDGMWCGVALDYNLKRIKVEVEDAHIVNVKGLG